MKKDFEKQNELIGLEEINQVETSEVKGGLCELPNYCLIEIPTIKWPGGIYMPIDILKPI